MPGFMPAARIFPIAPSAPPGNLFVFHSRNDFGPPAAAAVAGVELEVLVAEVGQLLFGEHVHQRVHDRLADVVAVGPPGAIAGDRVLPHPVGPGLEERPDPCASGRTAGGTPAQCAARGSPRSNVRFLSPPAAFGGIRVAPSAGPIKHPVPAAIVDRVVAQIAAQPHAVADQREALLRRALGLGGKRLLAAGHRAAQDQLHALSSVWPA